MSGTIPVPTVPTTTPTLVWTPSSGATDYSVLVIDASSMREVYRNDSVGNVTSFTLPPGILTGYYYVWHAAAGNSEGFSQIANGLFFWNRPIVTIPDSPTPIAPGFASATAPGNIIPTRTPTMSWSAVYRASGYQLCVYNEAAGGSLVYSNTPPVTGTSLTLPSGVLGDAGYYRWNVRASNTAGFSGFSSSLYFATPRPAYNITLSSSSNAWGTASGAGTFAAGSSRTVTATAQAGYYFVNWTERGSVVSTASSYNFTLDDDRVLVANFAGGPPLYTLTLHQAGDGYLFHTPIRESYAAGSVVTVTATRSAASRFAGWTGDAGGADNPLTVTMDGNKNITAHFNDISRGTIRINVVPQAAADAGGQWRVAGETSWRNTGEIVFSVPMGTYQIEFKPITGWTTPANSEVTVSFGGLFVHIDGNPYQQPGMFALNVSALNGTVSKNPNQATYAAGSAVSLTPSPASGYLFSGWSGDATGTSNPLIVTMTSNKNVTALFLAAPPQSGSIRVNIMPPAAAGAGGQWRVAGETDWRLSGTTKFGVPFGIHPIEFKPIAGWTTPANRSVTVSLAEPEIQIDGNPYQEVPMYVASISADNGTVNRNPNQLTYAVGTQVTLTAEPADGYRFAGWSGDASGSSRSVTLIMTSNQNVTANFECSYAVSPGGRRHGAAAENGSFSVTGGSSCAWTARVSGGDGWITLLGGNPGVGRGTVLYSVSANPSASERTGTISVQDQSFVITQSGANPRSDAPYLWPALAPIIYGTPLSTNQLNASSPVATVTYTANPLGTILNAGAITLRATLVPVDSSTNTYRTTEATQRLVVNKAVPTIIWPKPANITGKTALGSAQLNATASIPGTFAYSPAPGTVLPVGTTDLSTSFAPSDGNYDTATATVQITVDLASPILVWRKPEDIIPGTALSGLQLNAIAMVAGQPVAGKYIYSPPAGTVLPTGAGQTLGVFFIPEDSASLSYAYESVLINVGTSSPPTITSQPVSTIVGEGASATFRVVATGATSYQWQKDGVNISGATSNTLTLSNVHADSAGKYLVLVSNSSGSLASAVVSLTVLTAPPPAGRKGDIDGDENPDLLFQDSSGNVAVWLMDGTILRSARYLTPGNVGDLNYGIVGSGDFNADGSEDLLFQHTDGTLAVWYLRDSNQIGAELVHPNNPGDRNWRVATIADLNEDGKMDIIFQHSDGTLAAWFMNGVELNSATLFSPADPDDQNWRVVGSGDFNADGRVDLVFQHLNGSIAVWFLNGTQLTQPSMFIPSHPGEDKWRIVSIADLDKDGESDLVFQHLDGTLAVWLMNGTQLRSAQLLSPSKATGTWKVVAPK